MSCSTISSCLEKISWSSKKKYGNNIKNIIFRDKKYYGYKYSQMTIRDNKGEDLGHLGVESDIMLRAFFLIFVIDLLVMNVHLKKI